MQKYHASQTKKAEAAKAIDEKKRQLLEDVSYNLPRIHLIPLKILFYL